MLLLRPAKRQLLATASRVYSSRQSASVSACVSGTVSVQHSSLHSSTHSPPHSSFHTSTLDPLSLRQNLIHSPSRSFHHSSRLYQKAAQSGPGTQKRTPPLHQNGKGSISKERQELVADIKSLMVEALKHRRHVIVIQTFKRGLANNIEFNSIEYVGVLHSYITRLTAPDYKFDDVITIYEKLKAKKCENFQTYNEMLLVCKHENNYRLALELNKNYESRMTHNEKSLSALIATLAATNAVSQAMKYYKQYRTYISGTVLNEKWISEAIKESAENGVTGEKLTNVNWKPLDVDVHFQIVELLCNHEQRSLALETLLDFEEDNNRYLRSQRSKVLQSKENEMVIATDMDEEVLQPPSYVTACLLAESPSADAAAIMKIFEHSLVRYDVAMTRVVLLWLVDACEYHAHYMQHDDRERFGPRLTSKSMFFSRGLLQRCLKLGGALGQPEITDLTKALYEATGMSMGPDEYKHMLMSYCRGNEVQSAIETMLIADASGFDLFGSNSAEVNSDDSTSFQPTEASLLCPRYFQKAIAAMLPRLDDVDRLYFSLADLAQAEMKPPVVALNALIIAQGNFRYLDRAFAVFQEFDSVFGVSPDADTYHALLEAIAKSRAPRVENMLRLMSDMDDAGFTPDIGCFSWLLETMMKTNDSDGAIGILDHVYSSALKTVTTTTPDGKHVEVEKVIPSLLPHLRTLRRMAIYFAKRGQKEQVQSILQMIREKSGNKVLPGYFTERLAYLEKNGASLDDEVEEWA